MSWTIKFEQEFDDEFEEMAAGLQDTLLAHLGVLEEFGPQLGRPLVDTLNAVSYTHLTLPTKA